MSNNETVEIENGHPVKKVKNLIIDPNRYPMMYEHAHEITPFSGKLVAKDDAIEALFATYEDPVVSNAILLAPPGTGKTTLMKGLAYQDKKHIYLESELSEMITGLRDNAEMGSVVKNLFNEIAEFGKEYHVKIVIFVDEFHQLIDYSPVVAEAFKPVLAESGRRGLRLVVATTYEEFRRNIMPDQALTERLQRVSLPQPRYEDVMNALDSLAKEEKISVDRRMRELFDTIYNVTEQYMPAANQPRKSVLTFSRMIGYHRAHKRKFGYDLLAYTLRTGQNIEIDMRVDLSGMEEYMRANIFDQDEAVNSFTDSVAMSVMKMNEDDKPRGSWLLLGPTGVGKTELVKQAADYLFNDPNAFVRFDMTEYVNTDSVDRFRQLVTARLWEYPFSILLFDEIEKANGNVVRLLMQILDDGRLVDANDRVVNFSNAYIFGTSNLGSEIFESASQYGSKSRSYERNVKKSITETSKDGGFPPELVNRFDTIVPFNPLSRETMIKLLYAKARKLLNKFYKQHGVKVFIGPRVLDQYLGHDILDDDTEAGAGRQVNRVLRDYITKPVSTYIYYHPKERNIHVELSGETVYGNKGIIDSTAEIIIIDEDTWNREYGSM